MGSIGDYFETPLMVACAYETTETTKLLIDKFRADVEETDRFNNNCFHHALANVRFENMRYLHSLDATLCQEEGRFGGCYDIAIKMINSLEDLEQVFDFLKDECKLLPSEKHTVFLHKKQIERQLDDEKQARKNLE